MKRTWTAHTWNLNNILIPLKTSIESNQQKFIQYKQVC